MPPGSDLLTTAGLVLVAAGGAWYDVRERRVPNVLTAGGLALGLLLGALDGWTGLGSAALGAALGFLAALPVFLVGGLGGGDVKLLAAMGGFLGPGKLPVALLAIALLGGLMAAVEVIRRRAVGQTLRNMRDIVTSLGHETFSRWKARESGEALTVDASGAITIPYAVAISAGAVVADLLL